MQEYFNEGCPAGTKCCVTHKSTACRIPDYRPGNCKMADECGSHTDALFTRNCPGSTVCCAEPARRESTPAPPPPRVTPPPTRVAPPRYPNGVGGPPAVPPPPRGKPSFGDDEEVQEPKEDLSKGLYALYPVYVALISPSYIATIFFCWLICCHLLTFFCCRSDKSDLYLGGVDSEVEFVALSGGLTLKRVTFELNGVNVGTADFCGERRWCFVLNFKKVIAHRTHTNFLCFCALLFTNPLPFLCALCTLR